MTCLSNIGGLGRASSQNSKGGSPMIATTTNQELKALREESDWIAKQLERLQQVVVQISSPARQSTKRQGLR
jgi:hypothetical protein